MDPEQFKKITEDEKFFRTYVIQTLEVLETNIKSLEDKCENILNKINEIE